MSEFSAPALNEVPAPAGSRLVVLAADEAALIALCQRRHQGAFRQLYENYVGMVYALCLRLTADRSMAEDAAQEVFIQLWNRIESFRGESSFATWLHALCTNTTLSYLRRHKNWRQRIHLGDDTDELAAALEAEPPPDLGDLDACIRRLPERARLIFVLHGVEGMRQEEVAELLGIAPGTVKAQFHRSKQLVLHWLGHSSQPEVDHD
jgi:RNA polymerase sigma factor, sigma-70 family